MDIRGNSVPSWDLFRRHHYVKGGRGGEGMNTYVQRCICTIISLLDCAIVSNRGGGGGGGGEVLETYMPVP